MKAYQTKGLYRRDPRALKNIPGRKLARQEHQYKQVAISVWKDDLELIDQWAKRVQVSRSEFFRKGALRQIAFLEEPNEERRQALKLAKVKEQLLDLAQEIDS